MRFAIVLSLLVCLISFVSAQSLCFPRPSFLSGTCSTECGLRGHSGGSFSNGQCCCSGAKKRSVEISPEENLRSAEEFFGGKLLVAQDNTLQVNKGHAVSRISCNLCNIGSLNGGGLCCEASCKSVGKNSGSCKNGVCVCGK
ncbi:hypothetical protein ACI68E_003477 [Malassezia pachydermatis]|uniref:Invertebrate defensins family profile domain-containing protein n=1 Tax=Malassezia pachydermatis TaxID=77020 RepID=A0A0M8MV88_9BASI|nr:hypothetical protein Malapachy_4255 [Malassezia pachydermatis]KOS14271.1 hypothetical protein Malapachy_4255 [Malassezia pachydermatis]